MSVATVARSFFISNSHYLPVCKLLPQLSFPHFHLRHIWPIFTALTTSKAAFPLLKLLPNKTPRFTYPFCTSSASPENPITPTRTNPKRSTLVNFSLTDSDSGSDSEGENTKQTSEKGEQISVSKLRPVYDPFNKKPVIEDSEDPKNLQEVFQKIRSDGLMNNAVKMFDGLSKDGLTHEALELFSQIKDKGEMPDVVAYTAVIEAYANAGQPKQALKVYMRSLASGVLPNAYTYTVLIKGLAESGDKKLVKEAKKYVVEMVEKRQIKPNAGICVGIYKGLVEVGLEEEGKEVLQMLKLKDVAPEEKKIREALKDTRGPVYRAIMDVLYDK